MAVTLVVNNNPHEYPTTGDSPGWGGAATEWAQDVTTVLDTLLGTDDIPITSANILNNQTAVINVAGLTFNTGTVRAANIRYSVYRVSTAATSGHVEAGIITIVYDNSAAPGSKWLIGQGSVIGNSGVIFSITDTGQVQYKSTDIGTLGYSGIIKFAAQALPQ